MTAAERLVGRPVTPVGVLAARLAAVSGRVAELAGVDESITDELRRLVLLAGGLEPYLDRCTTPESPALARLARSTRAHDWAAEAGRAGLGLEQEMLSGHVEGQLLKLLVHAVRARRVLEIGTFTGYATLAMAEALPSGGRVVTCEIDATVAGIARAGFAASPVGGRIDVRVGPARMTLSELAAAGESFDLVFLDADKAGYADYVDVLLGSGLLAAHGLLCVDNTLMQGEPWTHTATANGTAVARFNELLAADPRVDQVLVPLRDGLTLARRVDGARW